MTARIGALDRPPTRLDRRSAALRVYRGVRAAGLEARFRPVSSVTFQYLLAMAQPPAGEYPLGKDGLPDLPLRVLEEDENIPPRPEEELADLERTDPQAP